VCISVHPWFRIAFQVTLGISYAHAQSRAEVSFIVLDANPLDNIINTRRISQVILRGAAVDRSQPPR
jgi:hypothetical protein